MNGLNIIFGCKKESMICPESRVGFRWCYGGLHMGFDWENSGSMYEEWWALSAQFITHIS